MFWAERRGGSNEYPQSIFWAEIWKYQGFFSEKFQFLEVKFSMYLNRRVFVMCFFFPDGYLSKRNMHQRVLLLGFKEGTLKWFIDDVLNIYLSVQYVKMMSYRNRFMYGTYINRFDYTASAQRWMNVESALIRRQDIESVVDRLCVPAGYTLKKKKIMYVNALSFRSFSRKFIVHAIFLHLTLVLLSLDMSCPCEQCRSRSVGFWRIQMIWICTVCH